MTLTPGSGDVVIIGTAYWYCRDGEKRAVLSHHPQWMPTGHFMATIRASAFRRERASAHVLCSGGPSPLIPASALVHAGRTTVPSRS